jgi:hypothetical protein
MWNAMFADAIKYSQKENQLNAANKQCHDFRVATDVA